MCHIPVMVEESLRLFKDQHLSLFVDATVGGGGFAYELLRAHPEIETYFGIDCDEHALALARERCAQWVDKIEWIHGNFCDIDRYLMERGLDKIDGFFFDLGVSSMQLDQPERGFSFLKEGPLDMRMDQRLRWTARDIVNQWSEKELGRLFREYGEAPHWRVVARAIVEARAHKQIETTTELARIIEGGAKRRYGKRYRPAKKLALIFQALRICVNRELESIREVIGKALKLLAPGKRLAILSFHGLEDRIVKQIFRAAAGLSSPLPPRCFPKLRLLSKKPLVPTLKEQKRNKRSRSAKLRAAERL